MGFVRLQTGLGPTQGVSMKFLAAFATPFLVTVLISPAFAEGMNLSWNDCGEFGSKNQQFDCASNSGVPFTLIGSFIPPAGVNEFLGISATIDLFGSFATLPDWWRHGTTQCRGTSGLSVSFDFTSGPFGCADFYQGQAAGGFAYDIGTPAPNHARLRIQAAVPFDNRGPVDPNVEYDAFKVNLLRSKSTGAGACEGCQTAMCISLDAIQLFQPPDANNDPVITNPIVLNFATWQLPTTGPPGCPVTTPTRNQTWGRVKSLYR